MLPLVAMREALVNAVVHRDYAIIGSKVLLEVFTDRIEITSPGTLPNHLKVAAVCRGGRTRSRNEQMANYMLERQFMEKRGRRGWLVMRKAMREFNGTEPRLEEDAVSRFVTETLPLVSCHASSVASARPAGSGGRATQAWRWRVPAGNGGPIAKRRNAATGPVGRALREFAMRAGAVSREREGTPRKQTAALWSLPICPIFPAEHASGGTRPRGSAATGGACSIRGRRGWAGGGAGAQRQRSTGPALGRLH